MNQETTEFFNAMESGFKVILKEREFKYTILDENTGEILESIDYSRVFFDAYGEVYKRDKGSGKLIKIDSDKGFVMIPKDKSTD